MISKLGEHERISPQKIQQQVQAGGPRSQPLGDEVGTGLLAFKFRQSGNLSDDCAQEL